MKTFLCRQTTAKKLISLKEKIKYPVVARQKKMQKWNCIKNWKWVKAQFAVLWCSPAWARYLVSHLKYMFTSVWGQALSWRSSRVTVFISETTPVWCCVYLHQREQMLTQVCAAKHSERLSCWDEAWKLCSAHRLIFCLKCVTTLELNQLQLAVWWCSVHLHAQLSRPSCKRITEQFRM